eukprot:TRINITY_DN2494_c0_g1_i2.p1 TRINITY_DN2494_c0_g1~~TRINITY_DN2494_c0_g1_i2.p1  ORF type:complete len:178 (+),score=23.38 TRINITY_DN2494_c0_g1_i2:314-847(+)
MLVNEGFCCMCRVLTVSLWFAFLYPTQLVVRARVPATTEPWYAGSPSATRKCSSDSEEAAQGDSSKAPSDFDARSYAEAVPAPSYVGASDDIAQLESTIDQAAKNLSKALYKENQALHETTQALRQMNASLTEAVEGMAQVNASLTKCQADAWTALQRMAQAAAVVALVYLASALCW